MKIGRMALEIYTSQSNRYCVKCFEINTRPYGITPICLKNFMNIRQKLFELCLLQKDLCVRIHTMHQAHRVEINILL